MQDLSTSPETVTIDIPVDATHVIPEPTPAPAETLDSSTVTSPQGQSEQVSPPQEVRDEKGRYVIGAPQDTNKNGTAGRPCTFCADKDNKLKITQDYLNAGTGDRPKMVYINELAIKLDCERDTIKEWANRKNKDELEHPEFAGMIKRLESIQELRLQQRVMGRYNPTGAIFLLKTKHNYMESEKRVLAGDSKEPIEIVITEEKKYVEED